MPLATKNGSLIVKSGSLAENCNCCAGGWYCYSCDCGKPSVTVTLSNFSAYYTFTSLVINGTYTLSHPLTGLSSCCESWEYRNDITSETCGGSAGNAFITVAATRTGISVSAQGRTNLEANYPSGGPCVSWAFQTALSNVCVSGTQSGTAILSGLGGPIYSFNWSIS